MRKYETLIEGPAQVEIFRTNVTGNDEAIFVLKWLSLHLPGPKFNIDLHDRDKVLRVKGKNIEPQKVIELVEKLGFCCHVLD